MKNLILLLPIVLYSGFSNAEALIFNGVGNYNNDSLLGVKIYRGSEAQKKHDELMSEYNDNTKKEIELKENIAKINSGNKNFIKKYELSNIEGVYSVLSINDDGTFYWSMKYDGTYLNTKGLWKTSDDNQYLYLNTTPKPRDIMFNYINSIEDSPNQEVQRLGDGDVLITINQKKSGDFDKKSISGVSVTCMGMYGISNAVTDDKGNALCSHAGYPLKKLILKAKDIPNTTYWMSPKFEGTHWNFEFDILSAHTDYFFNSEKFKMDNGVLIWDGRSLGANQNWVYN